MTGRAVRYDPPAVAVPLNERFGGDIALAGFSLAKAELEGGDRVKLNLVWHALSQPKDRYKVFVHLLNAENLIVAQNDSEPGGGALATVRWLGGEYVADLHEVPTPSDLKPGAYRLEIGLYLAPAGARLPVGKSDSVVLSQTVHIIPKSLLRR